MIDKKKGNIKLTRKTKGLILTICTAVLIGFLFGMLSLQMTKQEALPGEAKVYNSTQTKEEEQGVKTMKGMSFYVVQGGVFQDQNNAEKWAAAFTEKGFSAFKWQKDDQIYLLTSIATSFEDATNIAGQMQAQDLDVYVKEWEIEPYKVELPSSDYMWLEAMIQLWEKSLQLLEKEDTIPHDEWETLVKEKGLTTEAVLSLQQTIGQLLEAKTPLDEAALLEIIAAYEKNFKK